MIDEEGKVIPSVFKEFSIDEISAVDRPAQPSATVSIMKRAKKEDDIPDPEDEGADEKKKAPTATSKRAFLTTPTDGHTHILSDEVGPDQRGAAGETSWSHGHSHPWIMNTDTGAITIGMAEGHIHTINLNGADGAPPGIIDLTPTAGTTETFKAKDGMPDPSDASKSNSGVTADPVGNVQKDNNMSDKNDKTADQEAVAKQLEDLTKRAERAEKVAELSDAQRGIFKSLEGSEADSFLSMTSDQRDAEVAKAAEANAVVFEDQGIVYRKNDDERLVTLAKQAKAEREARMAAEKRAQDVDLRKRAEELKHIPGDVDVRMAMLKSIDTLAEDQRGPALEALKAQDAALAEAYKRAGTSTPAAGANPLDELAKSVQESDPKLTPEQAMAKALETERGQELYAKSLGE